jgi:malto-oligosyltrehalose trehalohydrolase
MRAAFETRWGAWPLEGGGARFRLWAPGEKAVALRCASTGRDAAMARDAEGWWEVETDLVPLDGGYLYALGDERFVPDPAARAQLGDAHGPSRLIDPRAHEWRDADWRGRPWEEAVLYELHVGTFTPEGTFDAAAAKLPYLRDLGVTAVELMPVSTFSGDRGWGYDGVLPYAPHRAYGGPEGLKRLVEAAHGHGLMIFLDVVYNHFGPDGNYLPTYAPDFFDHDRKTPWGDAIAYEKAPVRRFFVDNPVYWLEEYRFDGLRFDAIDQIKDPSETHILAEMAQAIRARFGDQPKHLCTEDDRNIVRLHPYDDKRPVLFTAEWNDDFHHVAHVAATGEAEGYYEDYQGDQAAQMAKALASGFVYQGEYSEHLKKPRGVESGRQPPTAFVNFIQNHDQVGNRAFSERLTVLAEHDAVECLLAVLLLSPQIPLLWMGEEFGEQHPFWFFTDFHGDLAEAVREGRRREFSYWAAHADPSHSRTIPDPNAPETFEACKLDWRRPEGHGAKRLALVRRLLQLRREEIAPRLKGMAGGAGRFDLLGGGGFLVTWTMGDGSILRLSANIADSPGRAARAPGRLIYESEAGLARRIEEGAAPPGWSVVVALEEPAA